MSVHQENVFMLTNGLRLHTVQAGPQEGPLVILLHGFPEFWYGWRAQIGPLAAAGFRVLVPDQRGYNLSDKPGYLTAYRVDVLARDVIGLIQAAGREKATLVGHDWGGVVAWWLAIHHPQYLERLVILNAPHPSVMAHTLLTSPNQVFRSLYALFFQIPRLPEALLRNNDWELQVRALRNTSRPGTFTPADVEQYRRAWWRKGAITSMLNWYRANFRYKPDLPAHPYVQTPTLILWGARDFALSEQLVKPSADYCLQKRLVVFEGATHWVQHEEAQRVNQLMLGFMQNEALA
jgi:epoxide hydrolase 4